MDTTCRRKRPVREKTDKKKGKREQLPVGAVVGMG